MQNNLTPHPGDYVRVYIPGRQKLVPCRVEAYTEQGLWQCRPLKKCSVDLYVVPSVQIIGKINPKEITHPYPPQSKHGTFLSRRSSVGAETEVPTYPTVKQTLTLRSAGL